jgi:hypothetical protein
MDFRLSDQEGNTLSRYRGTTTKKLDFGLLLGMIDRVLDKSDRSKRVTAELRRTKTGRRLRRGDLADRIDKVLLANLAEIVEESEPDQVQVAQTMIRLETLLRRARPFKAGLDPKLVESFRDDLVKTVDLAGRLAGGSILWVAIPGRPGTDRIVKFSYLGAHLDSRPEFSDAPKPFGHFFRTQGKRFAITCAWRSRNMVIPLLHTGRDTRYHLDIRPPGGSVEIKQVTALAMPPARREGRKKPESVSVAVLAHRYPKCLRPPDEWVGPHSTGYFMDYGEPTHVVTSNAGGKPTPKPLGDATAEVIDRQAHVYLGEGGAPSHRVLLQLRLKAAREGLIRGCLFAAVAITALMWAVYWCFEPAVKHAEMTVVLLSLVPVVLGYVVVSPNEQPFEHEHLKGVRAMALLSGCLPIIGALLLALTLWHPKGKGTEPDMPLIKPFWMWLAIASSAIALTLAFSYLRAAPSKPRSRPWRRWLRLDSPNRP